MAEPRWITAAEANELYGLLQVVQFTLNRAQIQALPTSKLTIVEATETLDYDGIPSSIPLSLFGVIRLDPDGTGFGNINNGNFTLAFGDNDKSISDTNAFTMSTAAQGQVLSLTNSPAAGFGKIGDGDLLDNSLTLASQNSGDFTGGGVNASMKVTVYYTVMDLS